MTSKSYLYHDCYKERKDGKLVEKEKTCEKVKQMNTYEYLETLHDDILAYCYTKDKNLFGTRFSNPDGSSEEDRMLINVACDSGLVSDFTDNNEVNTGSYLSAVLNSIYDCGAARMIKVIGDVIGVDPNNLIKALYDCEEGVEYATFVKEVRKLLKDDLRESLK